ncbi:MAG: sigma-54-dependent Fis family transcriptional regulator [Bacteroidales bacterium]
MDNDSKENIINRSHERSKKYGVEPERIYPRQIVKGAELTHQFELSEELIQVAEPIIEQLLTTVKQTGFIIVLTDAQGCILVIRGGEKTMAASKELNMIPGAVMSEESIGTNAMGTAISEDAPVQITAKEHFISAYRQWTCSAAPIHFGSKIIGSLNLTGAADQVHPHTLGLVEAAVDAIENKLLSTKIQTELEASNQYAFAMMNNLAYGVFAIDLNDEILWVNDSACRTINIRRTNLLNKPISKFVPAWGKIINTLLNEQPFIDQECKLDVKDLKERFLFNSYLIKNESNEILGYLLTFRPYSRMINLVNRYTGLQANYTFEDIIAKSHSMSELVTYAKTVANSPSTILITGESGTGKEVFAQAIHNASERSESAFVAVNCGAISPTLIESEIFGYEEGAFTGAKKGGRPGKFELANGGTIFLDEIGEMPIDMQVKLLRVLQEGEITRLGGENSTKINVRVIAATNKKLEEEVEANRFRLDLYYRLNVIPIQIPALRNRREDIIPLWQHFTTIKANKLNKPVPELTLNIQNKLMSYSWPGNIRELENFIEKLVNIGGSTEMIEIPQESSPQENGIVFSKKVRNLEDLEKEAIENAIELLNGNISQIAKELGVGRNTLYAKIKKYNIPFKGLQ